MATSGRHRQWITFNFESFPFFRSNLISNYSFIKNEIHIKIGGDHCGGSFKMSFQVANVKNPNRKDNTAVFSIFEAKGYRVNIKLALERFETQIKQLQGSIWQ